MQQSRADSLMFTVYPFYGKVDVSKGKDNAKFQLSSKFDPLTVVEN
jgi:hypothetical protein